MKPIVISVKRQKTEIGVFLACFVIVNALNVYSIIKYDSSWSELYMVLGYVVIATCFLYAATIAVRLLAFGIGRMFRKGGEPPTHQHMTN